MSIWWNMATATHFLKYILDNLAYGKTTHESSTYSPEYSPSYAVDGVIGDKGGTISYWKACNKI